MSSYVNRWFKEAEMGWVPGTNFLVNSYVMAGSQVVNEINSGESQPIRHVIEIENLTTLPYAVGFDAQITGLDPDLMYNGSNIWSERGIALPGRSTVRPEHDLTIVHPGKLRTAVLSCTHLELYNPRNRMTTEYKNLEIYTKVSVR